MTDSSMIEEQSEVTQGEPQIRRARDGMDTNRNEDQAVLLVALRHIIALSPYRQAPGASDLEGQRWSSPVTTGRDLDATRVFDGGREYSTPLTATRRALAR